MAGQPTTLTISYGSSSSVTISIPAALLAANTATGITDYSTAMKNIYFAGGFWFTATNGTLTFVPWGEITSATAQ